MAGPIQVDLSLALAPRVKGGIPEKEVAAHPRAARAVQAVLEQVERGQLGFWTLPDDASTAAECKRVASRLKERFDTLVVLGIGGSSLGGRMLIEALAPQRNERVVFLDNVDPFRFHEALSRLDLEKTCFNVVSKSGGTVETAAQFVVIRERLRAKLGPDGYAERVVATTDPAHGLMRKIADEDGLETLPIPGNVGGRFSVLTAVGLLPAAFADIDLGALKSGATAMRERCARTGVAENPALVLACLSHLADTKHGRSVHVVMPYCDRLRAFGEWYCQLWGESLGKAVTRGGQSVHVGPTPVVALGTTDQHSQIQLYVEGPQDKLITFVAIKSQEETVPFPDDVPEGYAYLRGHSMAELFDAERAGTALALARHGRPSVTLTLDDVSPSSLGQLLFLYEAATAFAGELYDINAFDQPGVEMGKRIAFALMGRSGYADALDGLEGFCEPDPKWVFSK